jgi:hypothetical protein
MSARGHSITSLALASSVVGTVRPSAFAVLMFDHQLELGLRLHRQVGSKHSRTCWVDGRHAVPPRPRHTQAMRAKQISHFFQNLKPETAIWLRLGYSPKQKPQRKGGVLWRLRLSRRARRDAARPQVQGCSCPLNQRCCESAGGEIVVTGLSGFAGVAAVAGGGGAACAGAASCALPNVGSGRPCG